VVASGIVQLSDTMRDSATSVLLSAGDVGSVGADGARLLGRGVDTAGYFAWIEGHLVFDNLPLRDVAARLERWFDIDIQIPDTAIAERRLTATITAQSVTEVLDAVTLPLHLQYRRNEGLVVIERRTAGKATSRGEVTSQTEDGRSR
jgi:ferric-dicitrate binding protein FerR (iron transport regulator)